jgi:hypothetical protein
MKLKIHGGTAPGSSDSLCHTCRHATIVRGARMSEEVIECYKLNEHTRITFAVKSCAKYSDASMPSLDHMEDIAWILRTDATRKQVGFIRPRDSRILAVNRFED